MFHKAILVRVRLCGMVDAAASRITRRARSASGRARRGHDRAGDPLPRSRGIYARLVDLSKKKAGAKANHQADQTRGGGNLCRPANRSHCKPLARQ